MKLVEIKQYMAGRLVIICTCAFLLAAVLTAMCDISDIPRLVANVLSTSVEWIHPALDAFFVLTVGAFAAYLVSRLVLKRTEMEEELKLKAQLLDATTDCVLLYRPDGSFVYVNEAAYKSRGYSREQLMAMNRRDLAAPEFAKLFDSWLKEIMDKRRDTFESVHLCKDGTRIPVEIHARQVKVGGEDLILSVCRDITKRKQAEEALLESEERFRSIVENFHDGIMILDDVYRLIYVNDEVGKISGYSREETIGQDFRKFLDEESKQLVADRYIRRQRGEEVPPRYEFNIVHKDGQKRRVEISSNVIKDSAGKVKTVAQILDITERKQTEKALEESEAKYRTLFEQSRDALFITTRDGKLVDVNQSFLDLFGYTREEAIGLDVQRMYVNPDDRLRYQQEIEREGAVRDYELKLRKKDGGEIECLLTATVRKSKDKGILGYQGIIHDITERKRAEEALERQKAYFQQLFDNSPDAIVLLDTDDKVMNINKGFEALFGYRIDEVKGRFINDIIIPEDRIEEASALSRASLNNQVVRKETVRKRNDDSLVDVSILGYPIRFGNKVVGVYAIYSDITERKRAGEERRELEHRAYLTSRLASIGEMAAGIAHEINNPLTAVIGFAQLVMDANIPDDVKKDIAVIHQEAQRAAEVAKNLLIFARKHAPARQPTDINSAIREMLKLRAYEQRVNNIQVNTQFDPELPAVMADYSQLQQVFLNIIINAESAMLEANKGGTLTITTQKSNDTLKVSFADNGPGIAKENLERVFDPFFTTKEVGKGTGLGLSLCHGIVVQHGGRIYARSKLGKGATFVVELPIDAH